MKSALKVIVFMIILLIMQEKDLSGIDDAMRLTVDKSVATALANNRDYIASDLKCRTGQANIQQIKTALTPRVSVSAVGSRQTILSQDLAAGVSYDETRAEGEISKTIYPNRDIQWAIEVSFLELENLLNERTIVRNEVIFNTKAIYWRLITFLRLMSLAEEREKRFKTIQDVTKTKQQYGFGSPIDSEWASIQLGLAQDDLARLKTGYLQLETEFKKLLGLKGTDSFVLIDELPYGKAEAMVVLEMESDIGQRPEIKIARSRIRKALSNRRHAKKKIWPDLKVSGGFNKNDGQLTSLSLDSDLNFSALGSVPIERDIDIVYRTNYFFGFRASYPLFDGYQAKRNYEFEESILNEESNREKLIEDTLEKTLINQRLALLNAVDRANSLKKVVASAKNTVKAGHIRYRAGKISLIELLSHESDHSETQQKMNEAIYDLNVAVERMKKELLIQAYGNN